MRCRGFTLIEVLVASTLFLLALGLAFGYLVPATRAAARLRVRSQLQQTAVLALNRIETAAGRTSPGGFSWSTSAPVSLGFNPSDDVQPSNGVLRWTEDFDLFWWDENAQTLRQKSWPPGPPQPTSAESTVLRAKRLMPERLEEIVQAATAQEGLILARGVVSFSVSQRSDQPGELVQPVTVGLTITDPGRADSQPASSSVTLSTTFRMVNQQ